MTDQSEGTRALRVADDFFRALRDRDADAFAGLWAADAVYRVPVTPDGVPGEFAGRDTIVAALGQFFTLFGDTAVTWDAEPMADPEKVLATWSMEIELLSGDTYRNRGVSIFRLRDDRIAEYTEHVDTAAFLGHFAARTAAARRYFALLRDGDLDAWGELWHDHGTFTLAQPVAGLRRRVEGRDEIVAAHRRLFAVCASYDAELTGVHTAVDSDAVCVQYTVHAKLVDASEYTNDHTAVFRFRDGLISDCRDAFPSGPFREVVDALRQRTS